MNDFFKKYQSQINLPEITSVLSKNKKKYDLPQNKNLLNTLEELRKIETSSFNPTPQNNSTFDDETLKNIERIARNLSHWRKGPFVMGELLIDSEWRSNLKWERIKNSLPDLKNKTLLDIGCNNGYFMFEMLKQNPKSILGIDPVPYCEAQFNFLQHFCQAPNLFFEMLGIEEVKHFENIFDGILNMGIIYHHPNPIEQIKHCKKALKKDGFLLLESITIAGNESIALFPEDRYAKMRNVFFVPTANCMKNWLIKAKFKHVEIVFDELLTNEEQRVTSWSGGASLEDFLDPTNKNLTIEGHPAPRRAAVIAYK